MKQLLSRFCAGAALCAALLLVGSACSSDHEMPAAGTDSALSVRVCVNLTVGHELDSRAYGGRVLDNADDAQNVSNVRVYLFRADPKADPDDDSAFRYCYFRNSETGELRPYIYVPDFEKTEAWTSASDETHPLLIFPELERGYMYKLLAMGRDDISESEPDSYGLMAQATAAGTGQWNDVTANPFTATTLEEAAMAINTQNANLRACELFAGCSGALTVEEGHTDFTIDIRMKRVVAGIIMYVENIPSHLTALADFSRPGIIPPFTPVPLITKGKEYKVSAIAVAPIAITSMVEVASGKPCGLDNVNKGFRGYFTDRLLSGMQESDGIFVNTNPDNSEHTNSILAGNFVVPMGQPGSLSVIDGIDHLENTLYLVFYTNDNDMGDHTFASPFYWCPIESVSQKYDPVTGEYVDAPGSTSVSSYPIEANHIYSLGERYGRTDEPLDLSALTRGASSRSVQPAVTLTLRRR